ncbi:MAG: hypothetical protein JKY33_10965 [Bacteroidia bacterium]|nr:hypothetical protein [Bacteroidia bacterium]
MSFSQDESEPKKKLPDILQLNGYVKDLQVVSFGNNLDSIITDNLVHNRLNLKAYLSNSITAAVKIRNRIFYGERVKMTPGFGQFVDVDDGYFDLSWLIVDKNSLVIHSIIDRAWMNWSADKWDIRLGRQRINWGVNLVWNPNDLFNVFNYIDFDYEERPGSDALRIQYYRTDISSIELAVKPGKNKNETVIAGMYKFNKWNYDFQFLGSLYYEDIAIGAGWAGNLKNAGFKGEATYFHPKNNITDTSGVLNVSVSYDYSFKNAVYIHGSVLYNSNGTSDIMSISQTDVFSSALSAKNLMPTQFSLFGQVSGSISPLLRADLVGIYGTGLNILFAMPSLSYSIKENWEIVLLGQMFFMKSSGANGNIGNSVYIRLKWSF